MIVATKDTTEILIVEDSPTQAERLRYVLEQKGYSVRVARNGKRALAALSEHKPTMVITDIVMPEMDGYELCRRIRANENLRDLPVILLTSLSEVDDVIKGLECGADNFITKPYEESYLLERIQHFLSTLNSRTSDSSASEVFFAGRKHVIHSGRQQILNFLLCTYEAAVQQNDALTTAQQELKKLNEQLEDRVRERTKALSAEVGERKRVEEEVRQLNAELENRVRERTAQLEHANKDLEGFSYSVSHDLRAPLRAIGAYTGFLAEDFGKDASPESRDMLERIADNVSRMNSLIEDLLKLFGVTSGKINRQTIDLTAVAHRVVQGLRQANPERSVEVVIDPDIKVDADESLLRIALENLIGNAWKFTSKKSDGRIEFGVEQKNGRLVYFVRDNGAGFDMSHVGRLFQPFSRLHATAEYAGTGIGLATVKRIINRHGGEIWAESNPGNGATFYFTL